MTTKKDPWTKDRHSVRLSQENRDLLKKYYKNYPLTNFSKLLDKAVGDFVKRELTPKNLSAIK